MLSWEIVDLNVLDKGMVREHMGRPEICLLINGAMLWTWV